MEMLFRPEGQLIPAQGRVEMKILPKAKSSLNGALGKMRHVFIALKGQVNLQ